VDPTSRSGDLDGSIRVGRDLSLVLCLPVDNTQHVGDETNGEHLGFVSENVHFYWKIRLLTVIGICSSKNPLISDWNGGKSLGLLRCTNQ
jgi:hypothetical protein